MCQIKTPIVAMVMIGMGTWSCADNDTETSQRRTALGAVVNRSEGQMIVMSGDPHRNRFVTTGVAPEHRQALCEGDLEDAWIDWMDMRTVVQPGGTIQFRASGDVHTIVYGGRQSWDYTVDFGDFWTAFCDAVLETEPLASGIARASYFTNNADWIDAPRGVHWGLKVSGVLTDADGDQQPFVHAGQCGLGDVDDTTLRCNVQVLLP